MKNIIVTEEYSCDLCGKPMSSDYERGRMSEMGEAALEHGLASYSYSLMLSLHGRPVEHICRTCLKEFLTKLAERICV